jgi:molybdate-binding protein/DNA-binding XRE family transcriptional regulator
MDVKNRLAAVRQQRGISAAALAAKVGVKRQTIHAIEAQRYIPNTLVALRLARALEVSVEELFSVEAAPSSKPAAVDLLTPAHAPDQLVRLCKVGRRTIGVPSSPVLAELPPADGVVVGADANGRALVHSFSAEGEENRRLLIAGCDPAMPVLARHMLRQGSIEVVIAGCSSVQALTWLKEGKVHVAGTHLHSESAGRSNLDAVRRFFPKGDCRVMTFASWEEGLVVAKGNLKGISCVGDIARKNVSFINRELGSGSRLLLDSSLKKAGISPTAVRGYDQTTDGHILAAWHVHSGKADCCIATRASARVFGLGFIPLVTERYDLVIPKRYCELPAVQVLMDALNRPSLKSELEALGGYDVSQTGHSVL